MNASSSASPPPAADASDHVSLKGLDAAERRNDRHCWLLFSLAACSTIVIIVFYIYSVGNFNGRVETHSLEYFALCTLGGVLAGFPHTLTTPIDLVKCRVQCGEYASASEGYKSIWQEGAGLSLVGRLLLFYRGWGPTVIGYSLQGAAKYGLYEFFKHFYASLLGEEVVAEHRVALFLTASACAEVFADVLLAPWEAIKVKMQTTRAMPPVLGVMVPRVWQTEGLAGFFKGLVPLWSRQVPYTMVKFAAFEKIIELTYTHLITVPKSSLQKSEQLAISLCAGLLSGVFCAIVSHPADSVVSKLNQRTDNRQGLAQVVQEMGCGGLWRGLSIRLVMIGTITALQWVIYDSFKVMVGLQTTGGSAHAKVHHAYIALNAATPAPTVI